MQISKKKSLLFPGCVIRNRLPFLEKSARLVFERLGFYFEDAPFTCCPDPIGVASISKKSWLLLAARNLIQGEKDNREILSLCNGCSETLLRAKNELLRDKQSFKEINTILGKKGYEYKGNAKVTHFVRTLVEDIGVNKIKKMVKKTWRHNRVKGNPIKGIKVAVHPGCHYNRPSDILQWDDPHDPHYQEKIIEAIGGISIDYPQKNLCCGSCVTRTREDLGLAIIRAKYRSATIADAQIFSVNCPACFQTMESRQRDVNKEFNENIEIPVFYITELIALAFGFNPEELGLKFHSIGGKMFQ